jgi:peptidoglycan hydrolase-like protein with peptidoglycan-binding domain
LNYYRAEPTGVYDSVTEHAVFKFQQAKNIVSGKNEIGAGVFGPKTRQTLNEIIASRNSRKILIAQATNDVMTGNIAKNDSGAKVASAEPSSKVTRFIATEIDFGAQGNSVKKLQTFLKEQGYFNDSATGYFGPATKDALIEFQKANDLIDDEDDAGAGRVGPGTLKLINSMS